MPNQLSDFFRKHFGFSSTEIRGLFLFIPIIVLVLFIPQMVKSYLKNQTTDHSEDERLLKEWRADLLSKISKDTLSIPKIIPRHFNPNKLTTQEWVELGFKENIANRILNYRMKGGSFKKGEDLMKIYGINQRLVEDYQAYIIIPPPKTKKREYTRPSSKFVKPEKKEFVKVNLNSADTMTFRTINGIGPYWSRRIVKFREELGGFQDPTQLYEMYGMEKGLADLVIENAVFEKQPLKQININQDSAKVLVVHPYISYKTANAIIRYRRQHGDYQEVGQLQKIISIPDSIYQKISPYLKVSD